MIFTVITEDLQRELKRHFPQIRMLLKKNPAIAYKRIGEIGKDVGKKYKIELNPACHQKIGVISKQNEV